MLAVRANLAMTYGKLGRNEESLRIRRDVYSGRLQLHGEEHEQTLLAANNYANSLVRLERFEEVKALLSKKIPVARRILRDGHEITLKMRWNYGRALYEDPDATLDNLREAVATLEETERTARRVVGGAHPIVTGIEVYLRNARVVLRARDPGSFQRASEEKLRTRRIVCLADRFRRSAATQPTPGSDDSRSTSTDAAPPPPGDA